MRKFGLKNYCLFGIIFIFSLLLIPKVNAKTTLELVKNDVSLTHACSYYKLRFEVSGLTEEFRRLAFSTKLSTLKVSKVKQIFGKLNDITLELKINVTYEVQIPDYETVWELRELNITNTTNMTCESIGCLPTEKPNICNCSFNKLVGYHNETRWKWKWIPILKAFYYRKYLDYARPDDVKIYSDNLLKHLIELYKLFKKSNEIEFRICGNYKFERTPNGWGISIDHIPSFDNQEFKRFTWWNSYWQYRRPITITEQSGNDLTNYQVAINISYDSDMNSDFSDLRFTYYNESDDTETEIPYWIEDKVDSSWARVWVKVPYIPANGNATVYMYYGNSEATSESNVDEVWGGSVFAFYDFVSGEATDWVGGYNLTCGSGVSFTSEGADFSSASGTCYYDYVSGDGWYNLHDLTIVIIGKVTDTGQSAIHYYGLTTSTGGHVKTNIYFSKGTEYWRLHDHSANTITLTQSASLDTNWHIWVAWQDATNGNFKAYKDNSLVGSRGWDGSYYFSSAEYWSVGGLKFETHDYVYKQVIKRVIVYDEAISTIPTFYYPEPTYSIGSKETLVVKVRNIECLVNNTYWEPCELNLIHWNWYFNKIRANCSSSYSISTVTFEVKNIYDNKIIASCDNYTSYEGSLTNGRFYCDLPTININESGDWKITVECTAGTQTATNSTTWSVPWGWIEVIITTPDTQVVQNQTFWLNGTVTCHGGECASEGEQLKIWADPFGKIHVSKIGKYGKKQINTITTWKLNLITLINRLLTFPLRLFEWIGWYV